MQSRTQRRVSIFELRTFEIDGLSPELLSKVFDHKWSPVENRNSEDAFAGKRSMMLVH